MRAPIEPGNPGWDPDASADRAGKVGAGLRGAGLLVILLAFLFTSQQFLGSTDDDPEPGPAAIYVVNELRPVVSKFNGGAVIEYGVSVSLREKVEGGSAVDAFVGLRADTQALLDAGACTGGVAVTSQPQQYAACLVDRNGARTTAATAFLGQLTSIDGRDALLQAGFELPPR